MKKGSYTPQISILLCVLLGFSLNSCHMAYHIMDIGKHIEEIPAPMVKSDNLAFIYIGLILDTWETRIGNVDFHFSFDSHGEIIYVESSSPAFRTPESMSLKSTMTDCLAHSSEGIRVIPGIAYYIPLNSGWNVEIGDIFYDIERIKSHTSFPRFFFKRHEKLSKSLSFDDYIEYTRQADILPLLEQEGNRKVFSRKDEEEIQGP